LSARAMPASASSATNAENSVLRITVLLSAA
jgi:hypothetical protein